MREGKERRVERDRERMMYVERCGPGLVLCPNVTNRSIMREKVREQLGGRCLDLVKESWQHTYPKAGHGLVDST